VVPRRVPLGGPGLPRRDPLRRIGLAAGVEPLPDAAAPRGPLGARDLLPRPVADRALGGRGL